MARVGFVINGILHIVIGGIAWQIAFGGSGEADQGGAIGQLAAQPFGTLLLWVGVLGCAALALWQLSEAVFVGRRTNDREKLKHRITAAGRAIVYAAIAFTLAQFIFAGSRDSGEATSDFSAALMESTAGSALLIAIGAGIIAVGAYSVYKGLRRKFLEDLKTTGPHHIGRATTALAIVGYTAKGVALAAVGLLFVLATIQSDPEESTGLDGALKALGEQPFGVYLLAGVGFGLICFGVYSIVRAKFARM